jgi:hypothetical protein
MTIVHALLIAAALPLAPSPGTAEGETGGFLTEGTRVRVHVRSSDGSPRIGRLVSSDERYLRIRLDNDPDVRRLEWKAVDEIAVSRGLTSNRRRGAKAGGIALGTLGTLAGTFVGLMCGDPDNGGIHCGEGRFGVEYALGGLLGGWAVGSGIGAVLGSIPSEHWQPVDKPHPPRLSLGVTPTRGGAGAALTLRF